MAVALNCSVAAMAMLAELGDTPIDVSILFPFELPQPAITRRARRARTGRGERTALRNRRGPLRATERIVVI